MEALPQRLFQELVKIPLIDAHSHIDPHRAAAADFDDLLGYHYYTELAHSAGMDPAPLRSEVPAEERARAIAAFLPAIRNTVQYSWLVEIAKDCFSFSDDHIDATNIDDLWKLAAKSLEREGWESEVLRRSNVEKVFLTNDFDDSLEGFDADRYVPCLRTDDLVFHLGNPEVVERLRQASRCDAGNAATLVTALEAVFTHFATKKAKACAVSLPPDFHPGPVEEATVDPMIRRLLSGAEVCDDDKLTVSRFVFWKLTELCREHGLPFDLMIGVNRNVYPGGVHQGRDLFNRLGSLHQYRTLFSSFPEVTFPVSVLPSDGNQELVAFSWIFPNVVTLGHWWYSNIPATIENDARTRLQAVPSSKQIAYYSDAYKLEFIAPKFNMYRRILAKILANDFVSERGWTEEEAIDLGRQVLRGNVERVFYGNSA
jgi:glucuronate isomerase